MVGQGCGGEEEGIQGKGTGEEGQEARMFPRYKPKVFIILFWKRHPISSDMYSLLDMSP